MGVGGGQANFSSSWGGRNPPPLGETMLTTCSLIKKQIFAISDIIIVTVIIDAISAKGFSAKNTFTLVIR